MNSRPRRRFGVAIAAASALAVALSGAITPAYAASTDSASCTSMSLAQAQTRILSEVNDARTKAGVATLKEYTALDTVALRWSRSQAAKATMSHNPKYAAQIPAGWTAAGENVAYGYAPTSVTSAWLDSKGHRANILRTSFTHIGIGMACSEAGQPFYTQVFGGYKTLKAATPAISGKAKAGIKLTAKAGSWTAGAKLKYQWYVGGKAVSGATAKAYTPKKADAGKTVKVKVTGSKSGYATASKTSKSTAKVAKLSALKKATPKIKGTVKVGKKLAVTRGTWTSGTSFSYRWYRNGAAIPKATASAYVLTKSDKGKSVTVKVTGKKAGYATASKVSAKTAKVK